MSDKPTVIGFLLDKSGSMHSRAIPTIEGYNTYIDDLKESHKDQNVLFSLTLFDTGCKLVHIAEPLVDIPHLNSDTYHPGGMTSLHDAVMETVKEIEKRVDEDTPVLIVIMTDGYENSSKEYAGSEGLKQVRETLTTKTKKNNWSFTFLGADADAWDTGESLGCTSSHQYSTENVKGTMRSVSLGTQAYSSARARGITDANVLSDTFDKAFVDPEEPDTSETEKKLRNIDWNNLTGPSSKSKKG